MIWPLQYPEPCSHCPFHKESLNYIKFCSDAGKLFSHTRALFHPTNRQPVSLVFSNLCSTRTKCFNLNLPSFGVFFVPFERKASQSQSMAVKFTTSVQDQTKPEKNNNKGTAPSGTEELYARMEECMLHLSCCKDGI